MLSLLMVLSLRSSSSESVCTEGDLLLHGRGGGPKGMRRPGAVTLCRRLADATNHLGRAGNSRPTGGEGWQPPCPS